MGEPKLTLKQLKFLAAYNGNGVQTCKDAGYKGNDNVLAVMANDLLRNPKIADAIKKRENKILDKVVMDRIARQIFWTEMVQDKNKDDVVRLRASELLAKSEGDFIRKVDLKVTKTLEDLLAESHEPDKV